MINKIIFLLLKSLCITSFIPIYVSFKYLYSEFSFPKKIIYDNVYYIYIIKEINYYHHIYLHERLKYALCNYVINVYI